MVIMNTARLSKIVTPSKNSHRLIALFYAKKLDALQQRRAYWDPSFHRCPLEARTRAVPWERWFHTGEWGWSSSTTAKTCNYLIFTTKRMRLILKCKNENTREYLSWFSTFHPHLKWNRAYRPSLYNNLKLHLCVCLASLAILINSTVGISRY